MIATTTFSEAYEVSVTSFYGSKIFVSVFLLFYFCKYFFSVSKVIFVLAFI